MHHIALPPVSSMAIEPVEPVEPVEPGLVRCFGHIGMR